MRSSLNFAFSKLEDFSSEPEDLGDRHRRELEVRVAEALEQGYQRGYEIGRSETAAASEAHISELTSTLNNDVAAREAAWQSDTGSVLVEAVRGQIGEVSEMLERHVAALMKPLVKAALYQSSVQKFHEALDGALEQGMAIEIRGSSDLVRGVEERLPVGSQVTTFVSSESATIEIRCDETTISANFAEWIRGLEEAIG